MQYLYYYVEQREMHKIIGMHKQTKHNGGACIMWRRGRHLCMEEDVVGNNKS